jgi:hypothetical protein
MNKFTFEPLRLNEKAPGGACELRNFDDVGAFIGVHVDVGGSLGPHWCVVRQDLLRARYGARKVEVYEATRQALAQEGWLAV